jgi:radical SAM protein with 4Fe4S-binding SPASM domain
MQNESNMSNNLLKATELTGILGRKEMDQLEALYGDPWVEYRKSYELGAALHVSAFPIQLDIELNASCNLRCPMCPISAESTKGKGPSTWFSYDFYKKLIDYAVANGTRAVKLNYVNEPLIRKDLVKFIEYAKSAGILDVYLSTNGVLMNKDICAGLIKSGLTRIQVSIDATTEDVYDRMRPGGDFNKVLKNIALLLQLKKEQGSETPLVRVNFVKTELNEHQLDEFIGYWNGRVDMIGIQEFIKPTKSNEIIKSHTSVDKRKSGFKCSFPFKQLVITNELNVLPCCTFWGEELKLGMLEKPEDLLIFWNSEKMTELRQVHSRGEYYTIPQCRQCVEGGLG